MDKELHHDFVSVKEYMKEMTTAFMEIKQMKNSIGQIKEKVDDMHKRLFEGNGEKPIVTLVREHEQKIETNQSHIRDLLQAPLKTKAAIADKIFGFAAKAIVILALLGLGFILFDEPTKILKILHIFLGKM